MDNIQGYIQYTNVREESPSLAGVSSFLSSTGDGWSDVPYQGWYNDD
jgi:hypothetical protein